MKKRPLILVDPGHGGTDPGAVAEGITEASVNLRVAQVLGPHLFSDGFDVHYTRYFDQYPSLADRVALAAVLKPALFLSLHCNSATSPGARGLEVFTSKGTTRADKVAVQIFAALSGMFPDSLMRTDWSDGDADKEADFYVLNNTPCPAVLVEMGFLSNESERGWLLDNSTPTMIALAITSGLSAWREQNAD